MDGIIDPAVDYVTGLSAAPGRNWPALVAARAAAHEVGTALSSSLAETFGDYATQDVDLIAFGSLARQEWASGSDVDWTLLIDGKATPDHRQMARQIAARIGSTEFRGKKLPHPGAEGIFGSMAFSHEIIHHIGGQADSNRNTTQRVLMLLEACPVRQASYAGELGPYERVTRNILYRYLHDDTNFAAAGATGSRIPRFLLNDIVRYWRTMCVDFAYKEWEQAGGKWAIRNIKLRMSRKLLFVSGLLTVFSCFKNDALRIDSAKADEYLPMMEGHLTRFVRSTSGNILVWTLERLGLAAQTAAVLTHYDEFLQRLDKAEVRSHLGRLPAHDVYRDPQFLELREISHQFQNALDKVFFRTDTDLREFTLRYGVF
ncbi:MAG TPA: hypothetical protein PK867_00540 [Pirellulales bacterium]|nr:hypothetical protein [Pirellulales bacterium]